MDDSGEHRHRCDRQRHGRQRADRLPVHDLARHRHPERTDPDRDPVEVGVKFRTSADGLITGIRYYKPTETSGTHVGSPVDQHRHPARPGHLHQRERQRLAAGHLRHARPRHRRDDVRRLLLLPHPVRRQLALLPSTGTTRGPLTALQDGVSGGNGVYRYTSTPSTFPNQTWQSENYWVDVVFTEANDTTKPTVTARTPAPDAAAVALGSDVTATFSEPVQQPSIAFELRAPGGAVVPATMTYDATEPHRDPGPDGAALAATTTYTAALSGAPGPGRQPDGPGDLDLHHRHAGHHQANGDRSHAGQSARPGSPSGCPHGDVQRGASSRRRSPSRCEAPGTRWCPPPRPTTPPAARPPSTPSANLAASTTYTVNLSGARDASGNQMDPVSLVVHHDRRGLGLPLHDLAVDGDPGRHRPRHQLGRARREVPRQHRRLHHRHPLLQAHADHRHPRRAACGPRPAPGSARSPSPTSTASGWQQATFATPDPRHRGHDVRRLLLHAQPATSRTAPTSPPARPRAAR